MDVMVHYDFVPVEHVGVGYCSAGWVSHGYAVLLFVDGVLKCANDDDHDDDDDNDDDDGEEKQKFSKLPKWEPTPAFGRYKREKKIKHDYYESASSLQAFLDRKNKKTKKTKKHST